MLRLLLSKHFCLTRFTTDTGANASAEEADEGLEDAEVKVNNIIHSFRLQSTSFDKKGYLAYLKGTLPYSSATHAFISASCVCFCCAFH